MQSDSKNEQPSGGSRQLAVSGSGDSMLNDILATHDPDGRQEVDVKALFRLILLIIEGAGATPRTEGCEQATIATDLIADDTQHLDLDGVLDDLSAHTIHKVSCAITSKCSGSDAVLPIFKTLSCYSWFAKVVFALVAYAVNYGQFWLVAQLYPPDKLAYSIAFLNQSSDSLEHNVPLTPLIDSIKNLIKAMLNISKCIIAYAELPAIYMSPETPVAYKALNHLIPVAASWTIRSVVACSLQIMGLMNINDEYLTSSINDASELTRLTQKVNNAYSDLNHHLAMCYQHINEQKKVEAYQSLGRLFETVHTDNMNILRALISCHDNLPPLYGGNAKKRVELDVLRGKVLLLLISDLDISAEELFVLDVTYTMCMQSKHMQFEILWLPVVDMSSAGTEEEERFKSLQNKMQFYSLHHPSLLNEIAIKYMREKWRFAKKPVIVTLDPQGRVTNLNSQHMIWIWGHVAYPFTAAREAALWAEETWSLELIVDHINPIVNYWIEDENIIILCGGEDIEWIRKFMLAIRAISSSTKIEIEVLYVGKSNPKERCKQMNTLILNEGLCDICYDITMVWFLWYRMECMWYSKKAHNKTTKNDRLMQEIEIMLNFGSSSEGWALISKGKTEIAKAGGELMLKTLIEFDKWKEYVPSKGFVPALRDHLRTFEDHHCNRISLDTSTGNIPDSVVCADCGRTMEKYVTFQCCPDL